MKIKRYILGIVIGLIVIAMSPVMYRMIMSYVPLPEPTLLVTDDSQVVLGLENRKCNSLYVVERSVNNQEWVSLGAGEYNLGEQTSKLKLTKCGGQFTDSEIPTQVTVAYYRYKIISESGVVLRESAVGTVVIR
jgi:hypothetical protein